MSLVDSPEGKPVRAHVLFDVHRKVGAWRLGRQQ